MEVLLRSGDDLVRVDVGAADGVRRRCRVDDGWEREVEVVYAAGDEIVLLVDGRVARAVVAERGASVAVALGGAVHEFALVPPGGETAARARPPGAGRVVAPMPGKVLAVLVRPGEQIDAGQALLILEAMKMEHTLTADVGGVVAAVAVEPGDMVEGAQLLVEITVAADAA